MHDPTCTSYYVGVFKVDKCKFMIFMFDYHFIFQPICECNFFLNKNHYSGVTREMFRIYTIHQHILSKK